GSCFFLLFLFSLLRLLFFLRFLFSFLRLFFCGFLFRFFFFLLFGFRFFLFLFLRFFLFFLRRFLDLGADKSDPIADIYLPAFFVINLGVRSILVRVPFQPVL